jgi:hypothetical protein
MTRGPRVTWPAWPFAVTVALALCGTARGTTGSDLEFQREPTWAAPARDDVRTRALDWLAASLPEADREAAVREARSLWDARNGDGVEDLLDTVLATLAIGDPRAATVGDGAGGFAWLEAADVADFERDAIKLWVGRRLVREDRFDEALPLLADLDVATAVDPATLLFHRAACQHWLLEAEAARESLDRLLERAAEIPVRYERVARLLRADLAALEDGSLDHVARRMRDATRRLALGMAGPTTRGVQDGVIESLDRLIAKLEEQARGSGGGGGGGGEGTPLDTSRGAGARGAGEVRNRDLGAGTGWGDLPPLAREEALQQIGREYPPHYREAIEQYFKRLATGGGGAP